MKTYILVDIEANGPIPGDYSMTSLGAVIVGKKLEKSFEVHIEPISKKFDPSRVQYSKQDQKTVVDAKAAMQSFKDWISENVQGTPVFISDNNGFDWMFVCWYFWHFLDENPFGYNSQNLNSLNKGLRKDLEAKLDVLRVRELTHNALEDARDNARILLEMKKTFS